MPPRREAMTRNIFIAAMVAGWLAVPGAAAAQISDTALANKVAQSVRQYANFTIFDDITIDVKDRVVTLTGRVTQPNKKDEIGKRVAKIDGIKTLTNNIGVLPPSASDDALRVKLARSLYDHPAFWRYAQMADRPIHIVVENGRVTLTGYVNDQ